MTWQEPAVQAAGLSSLGQISQRLEPEYRRNLDEWYGSPFEWLKHQPSRTVGAIFERLVEEFYTARGFIVRSSPDSDADRVVSGIRTEIKGSTLWANGSYKFQQLRDQRYEIVICLGISPFNAHGWVIPKDVIMGGIGTLSGLKHQHGGQQGTDTAWLTVRPGAIPSWLRDFGGTLEEATAVLRAYIGDQS